MGVDVSESDYVCVSECERMYGCECVSEWVCDIVWVSDECVWVSDECVWVSGWWMGVSEYVNECVMNVCEWVGVSEWVCELLCESEWMNVCEWVGVWRMCVRVGMCLN